MAAQRSWGWFHSRTRHLAWSWHQHCTRCGSFAPVDRSVMSVTHEIVSGTCIYFSLFYCPYLQPALQVASADGSPFVTTPQSHSPPLMNMNMAQAAAIPMAGLQANHLQLAAIQAALQSQITLAIKQQQSMVRACHNPHVVCRSGPSIRPHLSLMSCTHCSVLHCI